MRKHHSGLTHADHGTASSPPRVASLRLVIDLTGFGDRLHWNAHLCNNRENKTAPACRQPLVRLHPETGRKSLYLNPMRCGAVEGMNREGSSVTSGTTVAPCIRRPSISTRASGAICTASCCAASGRSWRREAGLPEKPTPRRASGCGSSVTNSLESLRRHHLYNWINLCETLALPGARCGPTHASSA